MWHEKIYKMLTINIQNGIFIAKKKGRTVIIIFLLGNQWRIGRDKSIPKTKVPETRNGFDDMWEFTIGEGWHCKSVG